MPTEIPQAWTTIERSLRCAVEGKRLGEQASELRERSKQLRQQAKAVRSNKTMANELAERDQRHFRAD
jgi:chromosome condensin MukBEF ATPase and DNA-binding subunit MukB